LSTLFVCLFILFILESHGLVFVVVYGCFLSFFTAIDPNQWHVHPW
jgi:hypothetical protein